MWNDKDSSGERFLGWNDIKEKLPERNVLVLLKTKYGYELARLDEDFTCSCCVHLNPHWIEQNCNYLIDGDDIIQWRYLE